MSSTKEPLLISVISLGGYFTTCAILAIYGVLLPQILLSSLLSLATFALVSYGLVTIAVESEIFSPFRQLTTKIPVLGKVLYELDSDGNETGGILACPMCAGMWVGTALAAFGLSIFPIEHGPKGIFGLIAHGAIGSGINWMLQRISDRMTQPLEITQNYPPYTLPTSTTPPATPKS